MGDVFNTENTLNVMITVVCRCAEFLAMGAIKINMPFAIHGCKNGSGFREVKPTKCFWIYLASFTILTLSSVIT